MNNREETFQALLVEAEINIRKYRLERGFALFDEARAIFDDDSHQKMSVDIEKVVDDIVNEFYWFDRKLFNLYRKKFHSIRKLSAATNISHVVVWRTINNCIKEIKKKISDE